MSKLPAGPKLHFALQRHITKEWPRTPDDMEALAKHAEKFLALFRRYSSVGLDHLPFLEIGSGRDLGLALALRCAGVRRIVCLDIERLAAIDLIADAAAHMARRWNVNTPTIRDWSDLERFGITYIAPAGLDQSGLGPAGLGCFYSTEVMEHIPASSLKQILRDTHDLLHQGAVSIHAIDFSDHYARSDVTITRFNFLTMTDAEWEPHNSRLQYVNRLRHSEYLHEFRAVGFQIVYDDVVRQEPPAEVIGNLAQPFRSMTREDISALRTILVARRLT